MRGIDRADFDALYKDYSESVDALQRAVAVLKKQAYDRGQASMVQVAALRGSSLIPKEAKKAIQVFFAQDPQTGLGVSAPAAEGMDFSPRVLLRCSRSCWINM